jgi:hypothetical protein
MRRPLLLGFVLASLAAPALAQQPRPAASAREMRELIDATRESAKAAQENVEYARVVPDILTQILAKLDKLENKLDKIENILRREPAAAEPKRAP